MKKIILLLVAMTSFASISFASPTEKNCLSELSNLRTSLNEYSNYVTQATSLDQQRILAVGANAASRMRGTIYSHEASAGLIIQDANSNLEGSQVGATNINTYLSIVNRKYNKLEKCLHELK